MDDRGLPEEDTVATALALALRAPSRGNMQPWRWRIAPGSVHLYLDRTRSLSVGDRRDVLLGCGAALHHLSVAFAALGWATIVHRMPSPDNPDHLATVAAVARRPTGQDIAMSAAITRRRSDRRRYSDWAVPPGYLGLLAERAAALGALIRPLHDRIAERSTVGTRSATRGWADDSPASGSRGPYDLDDATAYRTQETWADFASERALTTADWADATEGPDHADLLLLATSDDDPLAQLRAGEAMSAVLLTATNIGLATCPLSAPLDSADRRLQLRRDILDNSAHPQVILRVGQAPDTTEPPPITPRRSLAEVLLSPVHA
ncbi:Acg family FMN-binding oxidoreductase [Nocardia sp. bgisy134]|uniref:Acg family FMN-binding oxidoreductase n=1 Tax=unclassified Nocardia TaxID=2637762 RepID=UPI003D713226